jgi:glycosyltransferase involved in cell wall biosynthesis
MHGDYIRVGHRQLSHTGLWRIADIIAASGLPREILPRDPVHKNRTASPLCTMRLATTESTRGGQPAPTSSGEPQKLLIVASTLHVGGAERVMACLAKNLDPQRVKVSVCYLKENGVVGEELVRAGVELLPLPGRVYGRPDRLTFLKLRRLILDRGFTLVHTHDMHGFLDACACRLTTPGFKHVHTFHFGNYPHREPLYRRLERLLWRVPDVLVGVGRAQADSIRELYGIPESRMRVLWNGVDRPIPRVSPEVLAAASGATGPVIASISTLIPQKGLHHLIDAAAKLKTRGTHFRLLIVGGGHLMDSLTDQARNLGLDDQHVRFLGWVPEASDCALPACDIFVQSSLWEAMSVVVLEAMASGKAMVITSVGENPYVIEHGQTGMVVPPGDPDALTDALHKLLTDPTLRNRLGQNARQRHAERFRVTDMTHAYESLYAEMSMERRP